ncbi:MAG: helix-turn-helix domain-containing protein [Actinophytocola sp.]|nr:helix-turn-helix domain-containing protein [Actinophytocola sp.]
MCENRTTMGDVEWTEIGERIRDSRSAAGLSQADLARAVGLDRTMLAKIETGARRVDALELARFSATLGVPMEQFLEDRPLVLSRRTQLAAEAQTDAAQQAYQLEAKLLGWRDDVRQLIETGLLQPTQPMLYEDPVENQDSARAAARWLRSRIGNPLEPIDTVMAVCEQAGQHVLVTDLPGEGASLVDGDLAVAVVSRIADPGRRRATAAHELGHLVLGDEYSTDLGIATSREDRERVVDSFAAELLAPAEVFGQGAQGDDLRGWLIGLAARYRTSWSMAVRQAELAGALDPTEARRSRLANPTRAEFMEALGWAPQTDLESVTVPPSYAHAVMQAWSRDLITSERAVELMHGQLALDDLPPRDDAGLAP